PIATLKESNSTPLPRPKKMNIEKEEKSLIFNGKRPPILGKEELKLALQTTQKLNTTYLPLPNSAILDDNNDCPCPCPSLCF
nr:hypothetical protein [Parachlamydiaceae bacterium]